MHLAIYRFTLATTVATSALISGCSDPKAANESNFKTAIQANLDKTYPLCYWRMEFPQQIDFDIGNTKATLAIMKNAGLVTEKELSRKEYKDYSTGELKAVVKTSFDLTDKGRTYFKIDKDGPLAGKYGGFCFGKATVKEVLNFTEPNDALGQQLSQASYTYQVSEIPAWAKLPELLALNAKLKADVESADEPVKDQAMLLATNKGWVHASQFGKL